MVIAGVIIKNSGNKLGLKDHDFTNNLSMVLFIGGWLYCSFALSLGRQDRLLTVMSSLAIVSTVTFMKTCMDKGSEPGNALPVIFAFAWLVLGYSVSEHLPGLGRYAGLIASVLVLFSMSVALPYERKQCLVDGPGMPMFVIAWFIIIVTNSMR
jgi:hypothetical protein